LPLKQGTVTLMGFRPDGQWLATAEANAELILWDVASGREVFRLAGNPGGNLLAAFTPNGRRFAAVGRDGLCRIWDTGTGRELLSLNGPARVTALSFTDDGCRLVAVGSLANQGNQIFVWDGTPWTESVEKNR